MLEDFITEADSVFHGRFVLTQHRQAAPTTRPVELLAQYLVAELHDLYDPRSSDLGNLRRFVSSLDLASARLKDVNQHLRDLCSESLS